MFFVLAWFWTITSEGQSLSLDVKRDFLRYYSPVIFKEADESASTAGADLITNIFFDGDRVLANNRSNWNLKRLSSDIRPTLYTAIIEFTENDCRSVILLYHVYHAGQDGSIHDWERIEIRLNNVGSYPNSGESIAYVVVTEHSLHKSMPTDSLQFLTTSKGKHVLLWQAKLSKNGLFSRGFKKGELHFVKSPIESILNNRAAGALASLDIDGQNSAKFHYVFALDPDAGSLFDLQKITPSTVSTLSSMKSKHIYWNQVKGIYYELQDLADWMVLYQDQSSWSRPLNFEIFTPIRDEFGNIEIPAGHRVLYERSIDILGGEERGGYPGKHWFWGTYRFNCLRNDDGGWFGEWKQTQSFLNQHEYFVHTGAKGCGAVDGSISEGHWLTTDSSWYLESKGGFDGRWAQLFLD